MSEHPEKQVIELLEAEARHKKHNQIEALFAPGFFYGPHLQFFAAGKSRKERCFLAGNRTGKTTAGGFELVCHALGRYPNWWQGKRFTRPILAWVAGDSAKTSRDILQRLLIGPSSDQGTGLIPASAIVRISAKPGVSDAVESVFIRHAGGGTSEITIKSFDQQRQAFQGATIDVCWLDEEPPLDIYYESLLRIMTTSGLVYVTATPMLGLTDLLRDFLDQRENATGKFTVQMGWDEARHLPEEERASLLKQIPEYQRSARTQGIPQLGAGVIYPIPEADIVVADFPIPDHFPRAYGMDVGFVNKTACVWGARDPETATTYLYSEYGRGLTEPVIHAEAIKARGEFIEGTIDPAAGARNQIDGRELIEMYRQNGLKLTPAVNAVETGIYKVWQLLSTGKLKVFRSLQGWLAEYRLYMRDEQGKVIKKNDHFLDATRYLCMADIYLFKAKPAAPKPEYEYPPWESRGIEQRWMQ